MTSDPTYSPSPELVEACCEVAPTYARAFTAAVAYRTPDGHPELVPWEQVRELVEAARYALDNGITWDSGRLRAALAPFTREPNDEG